MKWFTDVRSNKQGSDAIKIRLEKGIDIKIYDKFSPNK